MLLLCYCPQLDDPENQQFPIQQLKYSLKKQVYSTMDILKLWHHLNMSASFLIIAKFLFMFCSWITSSSFLDMIFLLGGLYVFKNILDNSSNFLNLCFWERLKGRPSEIIRSAIAIIRQILLEVINFWESPSIPKISEPFEKLLELLSYGIFDAEEKPEITDELVSFDEVILLKVQWIVDLMAVDYLFCRLVMDALIFSE